MLSRASLFAHLFFSLAACSCASAPAPVAFISASGDLRGVVELRVQGVPVRVELDASASVEGAPATGRAALLTPLGGVECDLLVDDADCHAVDAAPLRAREETSDDE